MLVSNCLILPFMFGETPGPNGILGMGVAIAGVALAMLSGRGGQQESDSILPRYAGSVSVYGVIN